ncbi:hypothetical protein ACLB1M_25615 [Escherichia coli]
MPTTMSVKAWRAGLIAIRPPVGSAFRSHEASIIGNTCLYGATGRRVCRRPRG